MMMKMSPIAVLTTEDDDEDVTYRRALPVAPRQLVMIMEMITKQIHIGYFTPFVQVGRLLIHISTQASSFRL